MEPSASRARLPRLVFPLGVRKNASIAGMALFAAGPISSRAKSALNTSSVLSDDIRGSASELNHDLMLRHLCQKVGPSLPVPSCFEFLGLLRMSASGWKRTFHCCLQALGNSASIPGSRAP